MIHALIADARKIRVFEAAGAEAPREVAVLRNRRARRHERDLVSDRPGRVVSVSGVHHAYEPKTRATEHACACG